MHEERRPRRVLPVIVLSQFAGTSLWFAGNAVLPDLQARFGRCRRGARLHDVGGAARLHRRHARLRVLRRLRPLVAARSCSSPARLLGAAANALHATLLAGAPYFALLALAVRHRLLPRRDLSGRDEDRVGLVPAAISATRSAFSSARWWSAPRCRTCCKGLGGALPWESVLVTCPPSPRSAAC